MEDLLIGHDKIRLAELDETIESIQSIVSRNFLDRLRLENSNIEFDKAIRPSAKDFHLFEVKAVRFRSIDEASTALQSFYATVSCLGLPFVHIFNCNGGYFSLFLGFCTHGFAQDQSKFSQIFDALQSSFKGHFPGCEAPSEAKQASRGLSENIGGSKSNSDTEGSCLNESNQSGLLNRVTQTLKSFTVGGKQPRFQMSKQKSQSKTITEQWNISSTLNVSDTQTSSFSLSLERTNKKAAFVEEHLNRIHKRLDAGLGSGMWSVVTEIRADNDHHANKISKIFAGTISGPDSSIDPIRIIDGPDNCEFNIASELNVFDNEHPFGPRFTGLGSVITSKELSLVGRVPFHEITGIIVEKLTEYGRTFSHSGNDAISIGKIVDRECVTEVDFSISLSGLQKHCFVTGATGSGKSNTMRHILVSLWNQYKIPFLIIEPVKSEYRELKRQLDGEMQVFRLGDTDSQFSLNPFDFEREVGLLSHIDHLKAAFNASLGMYSSMPYIVEDVIYKVYQQYGWDLSTGENQFLNKSASVLSISPRGGLKDLFLPRLSDMIPLIDSSIEGFFPAKTDYGGSLLGALRARLSSMIRGPKGFLLDSQLSLPLGRLLEKPCVLELEPFADNDEKSFVMALILIRLYEYRLREKITCGISHCSKLAHLLVIEEAHRLLAKPVSSGEHSSQGRQKGVEVFADILAEIRSYGQGIIVVDQIPSKLIPDVLRNTDIKIAHRLVDKDDREIVGATMNLEDEQIKDLGRAKPGRASIYYGELRKPLRIQIKEQSLPSKSSCDFSPSSFRENRRALAFEKYFEANSFVTFSSTVEKRLLASGLVCRLIAFALATGGVRFIQHRDELLRITRKALQCDSDHCLWPGVMSEGVYEFSSLLQKQGLSPALSSYFTSIIASVIRSWINCVDFIPDLSLLKAENIGLDIISAVATKTPKNILDLLVGIHVSSFRVSFQNEVATGLDHYDKGDNVYLHDTLRRYAAQSLFYLNLSENIYLETMARYLLRFHVDDERYAHIVAKVLTNNFAHRDNCLEHI